MKRLIYILIAFVVFLSFTAVNVFAGEIDKAKEAEKIFEKAVAQDSDSDLNIDAKAVSDDELKSVVGQVNEHTGGIGSTGNPYVKWERKNIPRGVKIDLHFPFVHDKNIFEYEILKDKKEDEYFIYKYFIVIRVINGKYIKYTRIKRIKKKF